MAKWHAYRKVNGKRESLGYYLLREDAEDAELRGERTDKSLSSGRRGGRRDTWRVTAARVAREAGLDANTINRIALSAPLTSGQYKECGDRIPKP